MKVYEVDVQSFSQRHNIEEIQINAKKMRLDEKQVSKSNRIGAYLRSLNLQD